MGETGLEIAVIGMSGRFPGARTIDEFWENLKNGVESLCFYTDEELEDAGVDAELLNSPNYIKAGGGILEEVEYFDAAFFDYVPNEAMVMNPQMRLFHEYTWEALENAGYDPHSYNKKIGLYAGASSSFNWETLTALSGKAEGLGRFVSSTLANCNSLSTRVSYKLNLEGPSFTVQTTCSTSLVAIVLACQGILTGQCNMALAGGVSISTAKPKGYTYKEGMIRSPDGHCRAFDAEAKGTISGEGVGVVVLKLLEDAISDNDTIHTVIKGFAANNDGNRKVGYTAPSIEGQAEVIRAAHLVAEVEPESIAYVETHGTGTPLGDPVEIEALKQGFDTDKKKFCQIGSVKTNIGHLDAAAGAASFIKAVLALKHRQIPPSLHFESPNPKIDFENSPFSVNTRLTAWENNKYPLRAGVSSFGIGGTNAHVVLEEFSEGTRGPAPLPDAQPSREYQLILLSSKTQSALEKITKNLAEYFTKNPDINLADAAYTLHLGRKGFQHRRVLVCSRVEEAVEALLSEDPRKMPTYFLGVDQQRVIFVFPGLGAQYVNMERELYEKEPLFRQEMDRCFEILKPLMDCDIKEILYPHSDCRGGSPCPPKDSVGSSGQGDHSKDNNVIKRPGLVGRVEAPLIGSPRRGVNQTEIAQPLIFIIEYALAKLLIKWGIKPHAMIGYSFGEYAAACTAGVFSLQDALKLIVIRGQLMKKVPGGAMLSVPLSKEELSPLLPGELSLAIDNGPSCIVGGTEEAVLAFEQRMKHRRCLTMRVPNSHAVHSYMMQPILKEFQHHLCQLQFKPPQIPCVSNVTGEWLKNDEAVNAAYWAKHLGQTVRFADGIKQLVTIPNSIFIEVGPGRNLVPLVMRHADAKMINLVRHPEKKVSDLYYLLNKIGLLWLYGTNIDGIEFYTNQKRYRIPLPTYPFERQRYWIEESGINNEKFLWGGPGAPRRGEPKMAKSFAPSAVRHAPYVMLSSPGRRRQEPLADWFYLPNWKRALTPFHNLSTREARHHNWMVFLDRHGLGNLLVEALEKQGHNPVTVTPGPGFAHPNQNQYTINPEQPGDYQQLFNHWSAHLDLQEKVCSRVLHLWTLTGEGRGELESMQNLGFYSLLNIAKALRKIASNSFQQFQLDVISDHWHDVTGEEELEPFKRTMSGLLKVIPQEHPYIRCRSIDIVCPQPGSSQGEILEHQLMAELGGVPGREKIDNSHMEPIVAFRGPHRLVPHFESLHQETVSTKQLPLRKKGVYLITGGSGRIGLILSQYLASEFSARLILTGRSPFTSNEKIKKIKELEALGAEVMAVNCDVADEERMRAVINQAEQRWGSLHGVIHAAGIVHGSSVNLLDALEPGTCQQQFKAKIYGTLVLEKLFRDKHLDFCWLMSSISTVLGGLQFGAYAAANAFMDAFVSQLKRRGRRQWLSVNWDGMPKQKTIEAFKCILYLSHVNGNISRLVVSNRGNLQARIDQWINREFSSQHTISPRNEIDVLHPRPQLLNPYVAPVNNLQEIIAETWKKIFGFDQIGIQDDFLELGGDSLKAITVISGIHKQLNVEIPLPVFFNNPTVEKLAEYVESTTETSHYISILPVEAKEYYALSSAQKRVYFLQQMDLNSTGYNMPLDYPLGKDIEKDRIELTLKKLIARHESLRTSFRMIGEEPVQRIHDPDDLEFEIEYYDLQVTGSGDRCRWEEAPLGQDIDTSGEITRKETGSHHSSFIIHHSFIRPFDLSQAPLIRSGLIRLPDNNYTWLLDLHHIVSDGTSWTILTEDFKVLYDEAALTPLVIQYKDFSQWQNRLFDSGKIKKQEQYWLELFQGEVPRINLPADYKRPEVFTFAGSSYSFGLDPEEASQFKALGTAAGGTLYMNILAALNTLFYKYTGQTDIIIGSGTAGRNHNELQRVVGMFINTLAVRNYPQGEKTYQSFLKEVISSSIQAFSHQEVQFENLVDKLALQRDNSRNPLFDISMVVQNFRKPGKEIPSDPQDKNTTLLEVLPAVDEKIPSLEHKNTTAKFDLTFYIRQPGEHIHIIIEYYTGLFKQATIKRLASYLKNIIKTVNKNPSIKLKDIDIIPEEEKKLILYGFNDTAADYPEDKTLHQIFEEQAEGKPDKIAVHGCMIAWMQGEDFSITYKELNEKSGQLACLLIEKGVKPDTIVVVMMERSIEMIAGLLGILKTGGAYLPIDPDYPQERIDYMLKDSGANMLVTTNSLTKDGEKLRMSEGKKNLQMVLLDFSTLPHFYPSTLPSPHLHLSPVPATCLAYIIYTSGTTGKPKGTLTTHSNVTRVVKNTNYIELTGNDQLMQLSNYAFDGSVFDIYGALLNGAVLVLVERDKVLAVDQLAALIKQQQITVFFITTALFNTLIDMQPYCFADVRKVLFGGERVSLEHSGKALEYMGKGRVIHVYGPTETTVYATYYFIDRIEEKAITVPIGMPIANTTAYILDSYLEIVPIGVIGQLYIGGKGLARGYLNQPELTAEKFCLRRPRALFEKTAPGPHKNFLLKETGKKSLIGSLGREAQYPITPLPHHPIYMTGDLARWLSDGNIQFIGRIDHQVKIRGFRIEPGEIEIQLLALNEIKEAVVLVRTDQPGDKYLCAYVVSNKELDIPGLRTGLAMKLPDYMIPSYFVRLEKIPLTPNGKVNRKALPEPELKPGIEYEAPRNPLEHKLVEIWAEVLDRNNSDIGIDDNFFELGGHSLKATSMVAKIHKEFQVKIPLAEIFKTPSIRGLFKYLKQAGRERYAFIQSAEKKEYYFLSSAQKRIYILQQMGPGNINYNMPQRFPLTKLIDKEKLGLVFKELIARHESLRTSFHMVGDEPVQKIHDQVEFRIEYFANKPDQVKVKIETGDNEGTRGLAPLSIEPATRSPQPAAALISSFIRPFDLSQAPLLRVGLMEPPHTLTALRGHPSQEGKKQQYMLMIDIHHIITDGTSQAVLNDEFNRLLKGQDLPPLRLQYKDYSLWQNSEKQQNLIKQQEAYWLKEFSNELPVLQLPYDFPRPSPQSFAGGTVLFVLAPSETQTLKKLTKKTNTTLFMTILSILNVLLAKLSGQEDIIVGTPTAGRRHDDLRPIIGMFVNTLALRNYPPGEKTFIEFLQEVKIRTLQAFENQEYQFEDLVERISLRRDPSRNPVFDVMFNLLNQEEYKAHSHFPEIDEQSAGLFQHKKGTSKFDLILTAVEIEEKLLFFIEYCAKLFRPGTIDRIIGYFRKILNLLSMDWEQKISQLEMIPTSEKYQLLVEFNDTESDYPRDKTIHECFTDQVEQTPDYTALHGCMDVGMHGETHITYRELNNKSNQLAQLIRSKGVTTDTIVGIMVGRSVEMIIGILGILKAGSAYLPIESDYPQEHIQHMLTDSNVRVLLTTPKFQGKVKAEFGESFRQPPGLPLQFINIETYLAPASESSPSTLTSTSACQISSANLAYIIYTSGSTGQPKGIPIEHHSVINVLVALSEKYLLSPENTYLLKTSYAFDVSVTELFGWFWGGGRVAILEKGGEKEPEKILNTIERARVTHINFVPSMFGVFLDILKTKDIRKLSHLKYIFLAGEALLPGLVKKFIQFNPGIVLENLYGPTEATIYASQYSLSDWNGIGSIPIGKPLANLKLHILDRYNHPQPLGVAGELCISGIGLARGYLNRPELTAEKFRRAVISHSSLVIRKIKRTVINHSSFVIRDLKRAVNGHSSLVISSSSKLSPNDRSPKLFPNDQCPMTNDRFYKTGDLARWLSDGNIEFFGRIDNQVKIRGFRIEPGEIEMQLLMHKQIKEAVVLAREETGEDASNKSRDKYLCAYIVIEKEPGQTLTTQGLKEFLLQQLPGYMIPAYFVQMEKIPLTTNGKIDRKAFPLPSADDLRPGLGVNYVEPKTAKEKIIADTWKKVLKLEKVGIHDNFFDIGGNSLKLIQINSKLKQALNKDIHMMKMFEYPTIHTFLTYLSQEHQGDDWLQEEVRKSDLKHDHSVSIMEKTLQIILQE